MNRCFFISKGWKSNIKTVYWLMSLLYFIFLFPGLAAALQTAFIRANDGHLYEVTYDKSLNAKNFSIRLNGEILPGDTAENRDTIADLYTAASILSILPFEVYNHEPGLKEIYEDTANKRRMERLGKLIVGKSIEGVIGVLSGGATLSLSAANLVQDITVTVSGAAMEELLLIKAYIVARTFARMALIHQQYFADLWASVDSGTEIRIDDIKSSFIQFLKGAQYEQRVVKVMNEYLLLPGQGERAKEFFLDIIPFIGAGRFFHSTGLKIEDFKELERMLAESEREIKLKVSARVHAIFGTDAKTEAIGELQRAGKLPNKAPLVINSFDHQTLALGGPPVLLDAAEYFQDPEDYMLTYAAWSHDSTIVKVKRDGSRITLIPNRLGRTNVIVRVVDSGDRSVLQRIFVTVVRRHSPEADFPDLIVSSVSVDKTALAPGESFRLDTTVRNQGGAISKPTMLRFYRSSDANISSDDTELHAISINPINVGRQVTPWKRFTAPDVPGTYYYGVCVDGVQGEGNVGNNCSKAIQITVEATSVPDLVVESISVSKTTLIPGESFRLDTTLGNQGAAASKPTILRFYRSSDANISLDDTELHTISINPINVGRQFTPWKRFTAPDVPGTYYYGACVDGVQEEGNVRNNCSKAIQITVETTSVPDLVVESISVSKTTLVPGESFTLTATVKNKGRARSQSLTILRYYGPDHNEVGTSRVERLEPNQTSKEKRITLKALDEPGTYYYDVCVSRASGEVNTDNNCSTRVAITVGAPANQPPIASGTIPARTLAAESSSVVVDVSGNFRDPDNDALTYTVRSDNVRVVMVSVSGSQVTLTPQGMGVATITVTASDGELTAVQRFSVSVTAAPVVNRPPVNVSRILDQTLAANGAVVRLDLSTHFSDADGDPLTYTITSDNPNVAFLQVVGASVSIFPLSTVGRANVRVTASDGDLTAIQDFIVIVQRTQPVNQAPVAIGTIASQTLTVDGAARQGNISNYFRDPDGNNLTYTARSDDTNVVRASMSKADLTLTPVRAGSVTVTVTASDGSLTATQRFTVQVQSEQSTQPVNQPPAAVGTISPQTLKVNGAAWRVNVFNYFKDADGDRLTYTARSADTNVATVGVSDSEVTITPQRAGSTMVHVTASDGSLEATQSISVTVASVPPVEDPTAFDLAIQSVTVSKDTLVPGESFTLSITIHNNGPGTSTAASLSYYYSFIQGRTPEDQIHREGTVKLASLASGANTTKSFRLNAPSTPKTYYYGAWLSGSTTDTNLYNDVATEVRVNVLPPNQVQNQNPVVRDAIPDLVIESIRVSDDTLVPNENFTFYATVRNQGTGEASRTTLRYYRSSNATISTTDTRVDTDSVTSLDPNESTEESDSLRAPREPGIYYYGVCVDSVTDESNTNNNCSRGIRIRVEASSPDLVTESVRVSDDTVEVGERFTLYATVRNQGNGDARRTTLRYYRSSDSSISERDTEEDTDAVTSLDAGETSEERVTITAPNQSGTYYYGVCVDDVTDESNTNNNCSSGISVTVADAIIVRPPPAGLRVGDSVVVQNSKGDGLNGLVVRSGAGIGFEHIISAFDGATGTITDGPEDNNGYTWWKVRWDRSDQVFCDVNPCVGWAIEFFRGTRVLAKDDALAAPLLNAVIPTETVLLSNYPNPFNPETWIPYQLSEASNVRVSIYSVDGKLVRTLRLGHQLAGIYQSRSRAAYWDGRNSFGERVASGLYFYTFTAGKFSATGKMLVRK